MFDDKDKSIWQVLRQSCQQTDFGLYLGQMLYMTRDFWEDESSERFQLPRHLFETGRDSAVVQAMYDIDGTLVAEDLKLENKALVCRPYPQQGVTNASVPRTRDAGEVSASRSPRQACVILVPREDKINFLFDCKLMKDRTLKEWIDHLTAATMNMSQNKAATKDLESLCSCFIDLHKSREAGTMPRLSYRTQEIKIMPSQEAYVNVIKICLEFRWSAILHKIIRAVGKDLPLQAFKTMTEAIVKDGYEKWKNPYVANCMTLAIACIAKESTFRAC